MIIPELYTPLKTAKQELHRVPMYKILYSIHKHTESNKLATRPRIVEVVKKNPANISMLLKEYRLYGYVSQKMIKNSKNINRSAGNCSFHWTLTKKGYEKLRKLKLEFGEMLEIEDKEVKVNDN